jgi:hypothetical protein
MVVDSIELLTRKFSHAYIFIPSDYPHRKMTSLNDIIDVAVKSSWRQVIELVKDYHPHMPGLSKADADMISEGMTEILSEMDGHAGSGRRKIRTQTVDSIQIAYIYWSGRPLHLNEQEMINSRYRRGAESMELPVSGLMRAGHLIGKTQGYVNIKNSDDSAYDVCNVIVLPIHKEMVAVKTSPINGYI